MDGFESFSGAKIALLFDDQVLTYLRDDKAGLPFPAHWDLAGGGREGDETPEECVLRETKEEFGLTISADRIIWRRRYANATVPGEHAYFMIARISQAEISSISFGDEGQYWRMMDLGAYLCNPNAVPQLKSRLADYLSQMT